MAVLAAAALLLGAGRPNAGRPDTGVRVVGGSAEQRAMAEWAVRRFTAAGLSLPPFEIRFHDGRQDCHDRTGYYLKGVADLCSPQVSYLARRTILHELAHGWVEANFSQAQQTEFLRLRGLTTWNDSVAWEQRGFEHAAEIMGWALADQADGTRMPALPDNSRQELADAYQLLTGFPLPQPSGPLP
jgi:hypothetical protein